MTLSHLPSVTAPVRSNLRRARRAIALKGRAQLVDALCALQVPYGLVSWIPMWRSLRSTGGRCDRNMRLLWATRCFGRWVA